VLEHKILKVGSKTVEAICFKIGAKNLIAIRGRRGYVMCGYLDIKTADKFNEAAVIVSGVSTISGMIKGRVFNLSFEAKKLGIYKNQPIRDVLKIIA